MITANITGGQISFPLLHAKQDEPFVGANASPTMNFHNPPWVWCCDKQADETNPSWIKFACTVRVSTSKCELQFLQVLNIFQLNFNLKN